jgi:hypothetical protein
MPSTEVELVSETMSCVEVLRRVRKEVIQAELRRRSIEAHIAHVRAVRDSFVNEPVGGKLLMIKRVVFWFTASAFDRHGKVVDGLLDVMAHLNREMEKMAERLAWIEAQQEQDRHQITSQAQTGIAARQDAKVSEDEPDDLSCD